jgi:hypothetical protein
MLPGEGRGGLGGCQLPVIRTSGKSRGDQGSRCGNKMVETQAADNSFILIMSLHLIINIGP